jgi:hypothetical protein
MNPSSNGYTQEDVAALARKFWEEEGQPDGKAEEHWQKAEETLRQANPEIAASEKAQT